MRKKNKLDLTPHMVPAASLVFSPDNPRRISPAAYAALKESLDTFGLVKPLLARKANRMLIEGHQRLAGLLEMGIEEVPCVFLDITEAKAKALMVALNNPAMQGEFDEDKLVALIRSLDAGAQLQTGFAHDDIADMLAQAEAAVIPELEAEIERAMHTQPNKPVWIVINAEADLVPAIEEVLAKLPAGARISTSYATRPREVM